MLSKPVAYQSKHSILQKADKHLNQTHTHTQTKNSQQECLVEESATTLEGTLVCITHGWTDAVLPPRAGKPSLHMTI